MRISFSTWLDQQAYDLFRGTKAYATGKDDASKLRGLYETVRRGGVLSELRECAEEIKKRESQSEWHSLNPAYLFGFRSVRVDEVARDQKTRFMLQSLH